MFMKRFPILPHLFGALITTSNLINDISGKVGGNVFSRNGSGAYVKTKVQPTNPNTTKQQAIRGAFGANAGAWRTLTTAQQQLWIDSVGAYPYKDRLGNSRTYSGSVLYTKLNQNLYVVGGTAISTPKIPVEMSNVIVGALTMELTAGVLTTGTLAYSPVGTASEAMIITATPPLSNGINRPGKSQFKQLLVIADASTASPADIEAAYVALYGQPEVGSKIFVKASLVSLTTGQKLDIGQAVTTVTTL